MFKSFRGTQFYSQKLGTKKEIINGQEVEITVYKGRIPQGPKDGPLQRKRGARRGIDQNLSAHACSVDILDKEIYKRMPKKYSKHIYPKAV